MPAVLIFRYRGSWLQSIRLCPFWSRPPFVPIEIHSFTASAMLFRATCWMCTFLQIIYFLLFNFPFQHGIIVRDFLSCSRVHSLSDVFITRDVTCKHWAFYFQDSWVSLSCSGICSGAMWKDHTVLQELHAVLLMLHRMAFWLSGKVVSWYLDNNTAKACTTSAFLSRLACLA